MVQVLGSEVMQKTIKSLVGRGMNNTTYIGLDYDKKNFGFTNTAAK